MENNFIIVDRIEGNFVICEDLNSGNKLEIKIDKIVGDFSEGDILYLQENKNYKIDLEKTIKRRIQVETKFNSIW